jgi:hypothetical protein
MSSAEQPVTVDMRSVQIQQNKDILIIYQIQQDIEGLSPVIVVKYL